MNAHLRPPRRLGATHVTLAHGGGGKAMRDLVEDVFVAAFANPGMGEMEDQARLTNAALTVPGARLAFTTDAFVVDPIEFPGGDIGKIAVCGTVNDLVVGGAVPLWLSAAFIIEEGVDVALLRRIAASMRAAADEARVAIVTGDTKVVGAVLRTRFLSRRPVSASSRRTAICAPAPSSLAMSPSSMARSAIMARRSCRARRYESLTEIVSDCRPLGALMEATLAAAPGLRAARDATRGGLASALNEFAAASGVGSNSTRPCCRCGRGARRLRNSRARSALSRQRGRLVAFVPEAKLRRRCRRCAPRTRSRRGHIGKAVVAHPGVVVMNTILGGRRIVDMLVGDQLPRIC